MKKLALLVLIMLIPAILSIGQESYKYDFTAFFSKLPNLKTTEEAYNFLVCAKNECSEYKNTKILLTKAYKELVDLQNANNMAITNNVGNGMDVNRAKKLAEKMKNMSDDERKAWAMQNMQNFMPKANVHANRDSQKIIDAVEIVTAQQEKDNKSFNSLMQYSIDLEKITVKYNAKEEEILKNFQAASKTNYDPRSGSPYVFGEASDAEVARFNKHVEDFKKQIIPVFNNELVEKLKYMSEYNNELTKTYRPIEKAIESTNYISDSKETVFRGHLLMGHVNVEQRVQTSFETVETIIYDSATKYSSLLRLTPVKRIEVPIE